MNASVRSGDASASRLRSGRSQLPLNASHSGRFSDIAISSPRTCSGGLSMMFVQSEMPMTRSSRPGDAAAEPLVVDEVGHDALADLPRRVRRGVRPLADDRVD